MHALIDGDIITYSAGFASDIRMYEVDGFFFQTKKKATAYCKAVGTDTKNIKLVVQPEPIENCLHSVKKMIQKIINETGATSYTVYLTESSSNNFRVNVAKTRPYKGNRAPESKPLHYDAIRDYLVRIWRAAMVVGEEADDAIGKTATMLGSRNIPYVICSIDKDLKQIPGNHYNWRTNTHSHVTTDEARRFFWKQMLTGDRVDNIVGIPGIGDVKADAILSACNTEQEMGCAVGLKYAVSYDDPEEVFNEHKLLLGIRTV